MIVDPNENLDEAHKIVNRFRILFAVTVVYIVGGATFYHHVEHFKWLDSFYFCVVSLLTVGYGDLTPKTDLGKLFTIFYLLCGVGILAAFATNILRRVVAGRVVKKSKEIKTEDMA